MAEPDLLERLTYFLVANYLPFVVPFVLLCGAVVWFSRVRFLRGLAGGLGGGLATVIFVWLLAEGSWRRHVGIFALSGLLALGMLAIRGGVSVQLAGLPLR